MFTDTLTATHYTEADRQNENPARSFLTQPRKRGYDRSRSSADVSNATAHEALSAV